MQAQAIPSEVQASQAYFCKVYEALGSVCQEHGPLAYTLVTMLATDARVTASGNLVARASCRSLAAKTGCNEKTVRSALARLCTAGILSRFTANNNRSFYTITVPGVEKFDSAERKAERAVIHNETGPGPGEVNITSGCGKNYRGGAVKITSPLYKEVKKENFRRDGGEDLAIKRPGEVERPAREGPPGAVKGVAGEGVSPEKWEWARSEIRKTLEGNMGVPQEINARAREERCGGPRW